MPGLHPLTSLLYQALSSPLGIVLTTDNFQQTSQGLYKARREASDPALAVLQIRRSPTQPESEIWLVKGQGSKPQDPAP